jgi:hypothetical protein
VTPGEWIALGIGEGGVLAYLLRLSYKVGLRERDITKAQKDNDGLGKKSRGTLGLLADWEDLTPAERRHRAIELLEGK